MVFLAAQHRGGSFYNLAFDSHMGIRDHKRIPQTTGGLDYAPFSVLIAVLLWAAFSFPALAQQQTAAMRMLCTPGTELQQFIEKDYGETLLSQGVGNRGFLFQLWQNKDTGSWSILLTDPTAGMTCLVAGGDDWMSVNNLPVW